MDFKTLKKNSGQKAIEALNAEIEKSNTTYSNDDDRYWTPTVDKAGNGSAVIRFLSPPPGEDIPWVKYWDHGFQGPGGWYIEKSLTTLGKDDPLSDHNSELWNSGIESQKEIVRKQKRRLSHVSNILVVSDPAKPECDGNNYLYRYGSKIFEKISGKMHPEFADEIAMNPFDFWEGANFKLKVKKVEGYPNYDRSEFADVSPVYDEDDKIKALWEKLYSLKEINDPKHFKSYDELKTKLCKVLGDTQPSKVHVIGSISSREEVIPKKEKEMSQPVLNEVDTENEEDVKDFFKRLREE